MRKIPKHDEVREIFSKVYNEFYKNHREAASDEDFKHLVEDSHEISKKFDCDFCDQMLIIVIDLIEKTARINKKE